MIALNFTLIFEGVLFLTFLGITTRIAWRPLMRLMRERQETFENRRSTAEQRLAEAKQMADTYRLKLTEADQQATRKINETIYAAHRARRGVIDELRAKADAELLEYHRVIQQEAEEQRKRFPEFLPGLVTAMDYQVEKGGRLL